MIDIKLTDGEVRTALEGLEWGADQALTDHSQARFQRLIDKLQAARNPGKPSCFYCEKPAVEGPFDSLYCSPDGCTSPKRRGY